MDQPIAIVGGGLAGLALANGFHRKGIPYKIYEATERFSEIGAGISFLPNAIQALQLLDPELFAAFNEIVTYDESPDISQLRLHCGEERLLQYTYGDEIMKMPQCGEQDKGRCGAHRARLLDVLLQRVPADAAEFKKTMTDIEEVNDGVKISFADGTTAKAAAAICCDGIKSNGRAIVLGQDDPALKPVYSGAYAYRALVPREQAQRMMGSAQNAGIGYMWVGDGRYAFQYPVDKGKSVNVIALVVKPGSTWSAPTLQVRGSRDKVLEEFSGFGKPVLDLLQSTTDFKRWALFELPPLETHCKGRICLLGDAAHASTPHQGAGGSAAFEDAYVMSELLGDPKMKQDLPRAFEAYNRVRCARGNRVISSSRDAGLVFSFQHPVIGKDAEKFKDIMSKRFDWLWKEDLPSEVDKARAWFYAAH